jgi:hypothetical protein
MISVQRLLLASLGVVWFSAAAQAEWLVGSVDSEPGRGGVEHRHLVFKNTNAGDRAVVDLAVFSPLSACGSFMAKRPRDCGGPGC